MFNSGCMRGLALCLALLFAAPAWSHGGEEHSHPETPAPAVAMSALPRAEAQSEEFELVATLAGDGLTLYLDDYASNQPVANAQIEVSGGALQGIARQTEPGVYVLPAKQLGKPGKYPLVFSIQTATSADLLTTTLQVAQPAAAAAAAAADAQPVAKGIDPRIYWAAAGLLLLGGGVVLLRRRK
jgi:hypothetical protein